ncbi:MAG: GUN4 domain-containing protein [Prochloraceae cyanobacterium]
MSDSSFQANLIPRLEIIESQLAKLESTFIPKLEAIEKELLNLSAKIVNVEERLALVPDIYRYEKLQKLLAQQNFKAADWETIELIRSGAQKENLESITPEDMKVFPCYELQVIDRLWLKYSQGKFGFSTQLKIYQDLGGNLETTILQDNDLIIEFGKKVGWRRDDRWQKCDDLNYTISAPVGCHPSRWWNSPFGAKMTHFFFNRLITCNID